MEKKKHPMQTPEEAAKSHVWDCDSCLYDSFELQSFKRHLHSVIVSRSLSMPRLQETSRLAPPPTSTTSSKISRTFQKMLRSVFPAKWKSEKQSDEITAKEWEEKSVEVLVQEFDSLLLRASASQRLTRSSTLRKCIPMGS